ncbi:MAG TPA: polyphosphate kinase 1 [Pyrinomonadaceae bacterium]|nr:polyphosphate kinase 1 [Pyrinomonadaceae bacterium]
MSKTILGPAVSEYAFSSSDFINRDLSLLEFFRRVLDEARDETQPLLERLKFIAIFSSNLDEFFQIRVSGLKERLQNDTRVAGDALTTAELLSEIRGRVNEMVDDQMRCLTEDILPALHRECVVVASYDSLDGEERRLMDEYFRECVFPLITPQAVDPTHPFPYISGGSINLGMLARPKLTHRIRNSRKHAEEVFVRVKIPPSIDRFLPLDDSGCRFILVEDLVASNIHQLVPEVIPGTCHAFRITRDADIEVREAETEDLLEAMEENLKLRRFGDVVRLEVAKSMPNRMAAFIPESVNIVGDDIYRVDGPLDAAAFFKIASLGRPELKDPPIRPVPVPVIENAASIFDAVRECDILLHHPYMPYSLVTDFIREAVDDPDVLAIKMCLYRIGGNSPIAPLLIRASEMGKQVTVLIEIKARFDEENNIEWAKRLEQAGVHVVYGLIGLKTHCKTTLIIRSEREKLVRYVHVATGNYNPDTSAFYTDLSLLTARREIGEDATKLFNYLTVYTQPESFESLVVAPLFLRQKMLELIRREIEHTEAGRRGRILAKMNRLADAEMVSALYEASQAGVEIDLIVRGVCTLRPGVPGMSENIRVRSIVGRLLEHSRVYYFENGGEPDIFTGSSDWMPRNLDRRVEVLAPIEDETSRRYVTEQFLPSYLKDNVKARDLQPDGSYMRPPREREAEDFNGQLSFQGISNIVQFDNTHTHKGD